MYERGKVLLKVEITGLRDVMLRLCLESLYSRVKATNRSMDVTSDSSENGGGHAYKFLSDGGSLVVCPGSHQ